MLFKTNETWPTMTEDHGHDLAHPASVVTFPYFKVYPLLAYSRKMSKLPLSVFSRLDKEGGADPVSGSAA